MKEINQRELWDAQHYQRGGSGNEGANLKNIPNEGAKILNGLLKPQSVIFEVGSANGRDARYLASEGHSVIATDFSKVALTQLKGLAVEQGVLDNIQIIEFDVNTVKLPIAPPRIIDAFYARSALHVNDAKMFALGIEINRVAKTDAIIFIEGKTIDDPKIRRSKDLDKGLVMDFDGHLRRVWTPEFIERLSKQSNWKLQDIDIFTEEQEKKHSKFIRMIAKI